MLQYNSLRTHAACSIDNTKQNNADIVIYTCTPGLPIVPMTRLWATAKSTCMHEKLAKLDKSSHNFLRKRQNLTDTSSKLTARFSELAETLTNTKPYHASSDQWRCSIVCFASICISSWW